MTKFILAFFAVPIIYEDSGDGEGFLEVALVFIVVISVIMGGQYLVQQLGKSDAEKRWALQKKAIDEMRKKHGPKK